jgi:two-component system response regulator PilR (NtrC family)
VPVNCGAIPSELMESEFFGHRKGSFSGAVEDKPGLFQAARAARCSSTRWPTCRCTMQVKLLRVIQEKTGARDRCPAREQPVDVRILSATHKNLRRADRTGAASAMTSTTAST